MKTDSIQRQNAPSPLGYPDTPTSPRAITTGSTSAAQQAKSASGLATSTEYQSQNYGSVFSFVSFLKALCPTKDLKCNISYDKTDDNQHILKTRDGFELTITGKNQEVIIKSPSGAVTRLWGDPHVEENDGDKWDFNQPSTFLAGDNRITIETTPLSNGTSFIRAIHVYNRDTRISIEGIDENNPTLVAHSGDASIHDIGLDDGTRFSLREEETSNKFSWQKAS